MVKVLSLRLQQCCGLFTMLHVEGSFETDFLDIYLTTYFGVRKFKYTSAMTVIVYLKMFKIQYKFRKCKKKLGKYFSFLTQFHLKMLR